MAGDSHGFIILKTASQPVLSRTKYGNRRCPVRDGNNYDCARVLVKSALVEMEKMARRMMYAVFRAQHTVRSTAARRGDGTLTEQRISACFPARRLVGPEGQQGCRLR